MTVFLILTAIAYGIFSTGGYTTFSGQRVSGLDPILEKL